MQVGWDSEGQLSAGAMLLHCVPAFDSHCVANSNNNFGHVLQHELYYVHKP